MQKGQCHIDGKVVRSTFITDQSEFIEQLQNGKQIGKLLDMPKRPQAPKPIFVSCGGVKYNSLYSTFKIALKKGLDSEDADRRDSMNRLISSSFCRADENYIINRFFVAKWQDPKKCNFQT